jgi:hypothetical protein
MRLYREEKKWIKERPALEHLASYQEGRLSLYKVGEKRGVGFVYNELQYLEGGVITHYHPPMESVAVYGHEDAPFSMADVIAGLTFRCTEIRVITGQSLHVIRYPRLTTHQRQEAEDLVLEIKDAFGKDFQNSSVRQEEFLVEVSARLGLKYIKVPLTKCIKGVIVKMTEDKVMKALHEVEKAYKINMFSGNKMCGQ